MVARGARSFNGYEGYLFYVGDRDLEPQIDQDQKSQCGHKFRDAAKILYVLKRLPQKCPKVKDLNEVLNRFDGQFMIMAEDIMEGQTDSVKKAMESLMD